MDEGGEVALILEYDGKTEKLNMRGYALPKQKTFSVKEKRNAYVAVRCLLRK
jgi:hypothetical protein